MLRVYGQRASINVRKVLWCCEELAIPYQREERPADFLALNPNGLVPAIDDQGFVLWQSNSIIRYLATAYGGGSLYPPDPHQRGRIDQWIDWQATEFNESWRGAFTGLVRKSPAHQDRRIIDDSAAQWSRMMAILENQLHRTGAFVAGSAFTLADIPIALSVHRWFSTPLQHTDLPVVASYYARLKQRPAFVAQANEP